MHMHVHCCVQGDYFTVSLLSTIVGSSARFLDAELVGCFWLAAALLFPDLSLLTAPTTMTSSMASPLS